MSALITFERLAGMIGLMIAVIALAILRDRSNPKRITTALFWGLIAYCLLFDQVTVDLWGKVAAHRIIGAAVVLVAVIAGLGGVGRGEAAPIDGRASAARLGGWLFVPSLSIPVVVIICSVGLKGVSLGGILLFDSSQVTLGAFGVAAIVALALACWITKGTPVEALRESRRLIDAVGWAAILPMMLAILGGVFAAAKTGDSIKLLTLMVAPEHQRLLIVALYCAGMAVFTMIMGNAFAAFPVMTAGLALPILVKEMGANPAPLVAIGMYAGYCGTLVTPMAANFNMVPAALLELKDRYGVIRAQIPTAVAMFFVNIVLMYFLAFL